MTEDELDERTREALRGYRVPPEAPLDDMWDAIEQRHFGAPVVSLVDRAKARDPGAKRRRFITPTWTIALLGMAAALLIGVSLGRLSNGVAPQIADSQTSPPEGRYDYWTKNSEPYRQATTQYLGETAALLNAIPAAANNGESDTRFVAQAGDLLSTTRLLLDSPAAASDPRLKNLLEDLELVLAQLARLPVERRGPELTLIAEALEQRDVVPRLRSAVASISSDDN